MLMMMLYKKDKDYAMQRTNLDTNMLDMLEATKFGTVMM